MMAASVQVAAEALFTLRASVMAAWSAQLAGAIEADWLSR